MAKDRVKAAMDMRISRIRTSEQQRDLALGLYSICIELMGGEACHDTPDPSGSRGSGRETGD